MKRLVVSAITAGTMSGRESMGSATVMIVAKIHSIKILADDCQIAISKSQLELNDQRICPISYRIVWSGSSGQRAPWHDPDIFETLECPEERSQHGFRNHSMMPYRICGMLFCCTYFLPGPISLVDFLFGKANYQQEHRSCSGTPSRAESMWLPQPDHVAFPHLRHVTREHIFIPLKGPCLSR